MAKSNNPQIPLLDTVAFGKAAHAADVNVVPQTPRSDFSALRNASLHPKSCIVAEFWTPEQTIGWIQSTIQVSEEKNIDKSDLNDALNTWKNLGLNGKKLKEYAIEPNVFEQESEKWCIATSIISKFHINLLSLFVTFVVVDLINDDNADHVWQEIIDDESELDLRERCVKLAGRLISLQRKQHRQLGYPDLDRDITNTNDDSYHSQKNMRKIGELYHSGKWVIDRNGLTSNEFLIICSHIEIASSIVELFEYERYVTATIFNDGKQRVYASKIAPSFENEAFVEFVKQSIEDAYVDPDKINEDQYNGMQHRNNGDDDDDDDEELEILENEMNEKFELFSDSLGYGWCVMPFNGIKCAMVVCDTLNHHCEYDVLSPMQVQLMPRVYFRLVPSKYRIDDNMRIKNLYSHMSRHGPMLVLEEEDEDKSTESLNINDNNNDNNNTSTSFDKQREKDCEKCKDEFIKKLLFLDPFLGWAMEWMIDFRYNTLNTQYCEYYGFLWFRTDFEAQRAVKYLNHITFDSRFRCVAQMTVDTSHTVYLPLKTIENKERKDSINSVNEQVKAVKKIVRKQEERRDTRFSRLVTMRFLTVAMKIDPHVNEVEKRLKESMNDRDIGHYLIVQSKRLLKYENYGYLTFHCWNKQRAIEIKNILQNIVDTDDSIHDNPEIDEESNDLKTYQIIRNFSWGCFFFRLGIFLFPPLLCLENKWLIEPLRQAGNDKIKPFFNWKAVWLIWIIHVTLWLPILSTETKYSQDKGDLSYVEIFVPRIFALFLMIFYLAWDAYQPQFFYPCKHSLLHLNLSLQCSNTVAPTVKSAFKLLADHRILTYPNPDKFPLDLPKRLKFIYVLFFVLSLVLPVLGALPRVLDKHEFCESDWGIMKCIVVVYNDITLVILTFIIFLLFNTIMNSIQRYFKDVTFLTDLIIDREFFDGTIGSSNIFKSCFPALFANEAIRQHYVLFCPLNTEQNQLAWYACRSYIKRKGGIVLATLEMHIVFLICFLFFFILALLFSIFYGNDISGDSGTNQTYYKNAAILGDSFIVVISLWFGAQMMFKGKRFEDVNDKQLSRLQRQRSYLFKTNLQMSTMYNNNVFGMARNQIQNDSNLRNRGASLATVAFSAVGGVDGVGSHVARTRGMEQGLPVDTTALMQLGSSDTQVQNIVRSLERIIDDCRNLDLCPLC